MSRWFREAAVVWVRPIKAEPLPTAFERELDRRALGRGSRLTCVVAGEGVRYRVIPWNSALTNPLQRQVLAVNCFNEAYGDVSRGWAVRQHAGRHGAASLACAMDIALLDQLAALAQARQLRLTSVQPALMHAYNQVRCQLAGDLYWFVGVAGDFVTVLLMSTGEPLLVRTLASGGVALATLLDREWFVLGMEVPRCPVYVVQMASALAASLDISHGAWPVTELPMLTDAPACGLEMPNPMQASTSGEAQRASP